MIVRSVATGVLLSVIAHMSPAIARGSIGVADHPWNPEHVSQLPPEVRSAIGHLCGSSLQAAHYFATYSENSRLLNLHFEHSQCPSQRVCTQAGCLHQVYILTNKRYRLLRSFYGPSND